MNLVPTELRYVRERRELLLSYGDGMHHALSAELLRVYSPSAEVRGHGDGQEVLQVGKEHVAITAIEPVGNYGVKIRFSDGHATGIYGWDYLRELGQNRETLWSEYLAKLAASGHVRQQS